MYIYFLSSYCLINNLKLFKIIYFGAKIYVGLTLFEFYIKSETLQKMYGRNNVFNAEMNTSTNYSQNRTTPNYSNGYTNNSSGNNQNSNNSPMIGSYRVDHVDQQLTSNLKRIMSTWGDQGGAPVSIVCKEKTLHLSSTQLRIEDYYLIRNKKLRTKNEQRLRQSVRKDSFNEQLIKIECPSLFPYSNQRPLNIQSLVNVRGNSQSNYGSNSNNSNNYSINSVFNSGNNNNSRSNTLGTNNTTSNNIFMKNSTNGGSDIFNKIGTPNNGSSNNSNNTYNTGNHNGNTSNNIFTNSTNSNNTAANVFGHQNNSQSQGLNGSNTNGTNNKITNNLFSSNQGMNNSNKITSNHTNSNGANIFNSGNNNSNNSGNVFSSNGNNGNSNSGNHNSSNFNNNGNNQSNNLFNSNNNNNNNSNNSSNNNYHNYSSSNSLFSGDGSNIPSNLPNNQQLTLQYQLQAYLQESRQVMQLILNSQEQTPQRQNNNYYQYRQNYQKRQEQEYQAMNYLYNQRKRNQNQLIPCFVQIKNPSKVDDTDDYQNVNNTNSFKANQSHPFSKIVQSKIISKSSLSKVSKNQNSIFHSKIPNNKTILSQTHKLISNTACKCNINLSIEWTDDQRRLIKNKYTIIQSQMPFQHINLEDSHQFINQLKNRYKFIRKDAELVIDRVRCKIEGGIFTIAGKIRQRIVNLNDYMIYYSTIIGKHIINLTLTKEDIATISWDNPINLQQLDFDENSFNIDQQSINCSIDSLNSKCRLTYERLPQDFQILYSKSNKEVVKAKLDKRFKFINMNQFKNEEIFKLSDVWDDGSWSMIIKKFA